MTETCIVCPAGEVQLSTLIAGAELPGRLVTGLTLMIPDGGTLVLDGGDVCTSVQKLWVEGPVPSVVHNVHNAGSYRGVSAGLKGQATTLAAVFPRLEGVYLKYLQYDVDWQGWADAAVRLREQVLWTYENIDRALEFPVDCKVELNGLISHYQTNPMMTLQFLRVSLQCTRHFTWHIGYYDPDQVSLLKSLESTIASVNGA
jgi:hypothetical protein